MVPHVSHIHVDLRTIPEFCSNCQHHFRWQCKSFASSDTINAFYPNRRDMRYVLLKHEKDDEFHVDFLLDCEAERLLSWQLSGENFTWSLVSDAKFFNLAESPKRKIDTIATFCRRIFDHRKVYLDYEGEISENRGRVVRAECGNWEIVLCDTRKLVLETSGIRSTDHLPTIKQWHFEPPEDSVIDTRNFSPSNLMERLPPPGEADWRLRCRFLHSGQPFF